VGPQGVAGAAGPQGPAGGAWTSLENVNFEFQRADITPQCAEKIAKLATWMNENRQVAIGLEGAQLVEVLPKEEFDEQHLPGAIHLPLRRIDAGIRASLDPERPVVLYCWDSA
jgi:Rhodanese-like domain